MGHREERGSGWMIEMLSTGVARHCISHCMRIGVRLCMRMGMGLCMRMGLCMQDRSEDELHKKDESEALYEYRSEDAVLNENKASDSCHEVISSES